MAGGAGIQVDGLQESIRGLRRVDAELAKEVRREMRNAAKAVAVEARKVDPPHASSPSRRTFITWRADSRGAYVSLNVRREPRAVADEFGRSVHEVFGRARPMRFMRRATWAPRNEGNANILDGGGYVVQPTIRRLLPKFEDDLADALLVLYRKALSRG